MKNSAARWLPQYVLLAWVWGSSFAYTEAGLEVMSPIGVSALRHVFGSLTLILVLLALGKFPKRGEISGLLYRRMILVAILLNVIPGTLFAFAQNYVSTVVAAIINSATPIMTLVMMLLLFRQEKVRPHQVLGLFIGLLGGLVALGIRFDDFGQNDPIGVVAVILAICCYGFAIPYVRNYVTPLGAPSLTLAHLQVFLAAIILLVGFVIEVLLGVPAFTPNSNPWLLIQLLLLSLGTGIGYIWHFQVIERAGSAVASSIAYPTLLVSLIIGWLVLLEPFSWNMPIGAALIVLGSVITQRNQVQQKPERSRA